MGIAYLSGTGSIITSGSTVPFPNLIHRHDSCVGPDLRLKKGWHKVTLDVNLSSVAGGNATISILMDGVTVADTVITLPAAGLESVTITAVVKAKCCGSMLTVAYSGPEPNFNDYKLVIENV